jgi:hypothetical protein
MKKIALEAAKDQADALAAVGYFAGVLATMWAEIAIEEAQDDQAVKFFWMMKKNLGMSEN